MKILIINGPNLNRLGKRKPEIYGRKTMEDVLAEIRSAQPDTEVEYMQSNHEGDLIDKLQETDAEGIIINPGGLCHTSVSLRDAVEETGDRGIKTVEVHISDISKREAFRRESLLTRVCAHNIKGHGTDGYKEAAQWLKEH
ncbi:MAG: 3-dehydroquinate dehydratase [Paludibacteraceae bacterium]|nr:3-dehydroquinate dehydratase [Paludibacteraceae bacterium]